MMGAVDKNQIYQTTNRPQRIQIKKPTQWILLWYKEGRKNYMKAKDYLRSQLYNDKEYNCKGYGKGILVETKNSLISRILMSKNFINSDESPFSKSEEHKKFNEYWWTIRSNDLAEYTKEEVETMCPEWVTQVIMPNKVHEEKIRGLLIIEL